MKPEEHSTRPDQRPEQEYTGPIDRESLRKMERIGSLSPGDVINGRYRVDRFLGKGGFGVVFAAFDLILHSPVALKFYFPEATRDERNFTRIRREINLARGIQEERIIRIHSLEEWPGGFFLVSELVEGTSLRDRLAEPQAVSWADFRPFFQQIVEAVAVLHRHGIIHRDLKPSNIMLFGETIRVLDFGMAKEIGDREKTSSTGELVGSPMYISPEQILGATVTQTSDVYQLGLILYRALSGQHPFRDATTMEMILKHLNKKPERLARLGVKVPRYVQAAISLALAKKPSQRFRDAGEMAAFLSGRRLSRTVRRRWPLAAAALLLIGLGFGTRAVLQQDAGATAYFRPVAYYPSDGNVLDASGFNRHGNVYGASLVADRFGRPGSAFAFDGRASYLLTDFHGIAGGYPRTVSLWARCGMAPGKPGLALGFGKGGAYGNVFDCLVGRDGGDLVVGTSTGRERVVSRGPADDGRWHHYAWVLHPSPAPRLGEVRVFVDGVQLDQVVESVRPWTPIDTYLHSLTAIGYNEFSYEERQPHFAGDIDDVRIYDHALELPELNKLVAETEDLAAYFPFDGNARDETGNGNHGIVHGVTPIPDRQGRARRAMYFNGRNDWVRVDNSPTVNVDGRSSLTLCAWVRPEGKPGSMSIISKWGPDDFRDDQFILELAKGRLHLILATQPQNVFFSREMKLNAWAFVAAVFDHERQRGRLFVDGRVEYDQAMNYAFPDHPYFIEIGRVSAENYFQGAIDDLRIFKKAVDEREIAALMALK